MSGIALRESFDGMMPAEISDDGWEISLSGAENEGSSVCTGKKGSCCCENCAFLLPETFEILETSEVFTVCSVSRGANEEAVYLFNEELRVFRRALLTK